MMKKAENKTEEKVVYTVECTRAKEIKEGCVAFDAKVNGVSIYGLFYREGVKDGKEYSFISFPAEKGKDKDGNEKYFNRVFFPIDEKLKDNIVGQLEKLI